jgi:hypothetical protein
MTAIATPSPFAPPRTGPQARQLLLLLYQYVVANTGSHPALLPAVAGLRQAAQSYGRGDFPAAFQTGVDVYQFLVRVRGNSPDLPLP